MGERADRLREAGACGADHPCGEGARAGDRDLLAEHPADGELGGVGRGRHPASRRGGDQPGERGVRAQCVVDGCRVGVQVEHPPAAGDRRAEVAQVGQPEPSGDGRGAAGRGGEPDDRGAVRQVEDAGERRPVPLLEAGNGVRAEEEQDLAERRTEPAPRAGG